MLIVMAMERPEPNLYILDKFLVMAEKYQVDIFIAFNKIDLVDEETVEKIRNIYEPIYGIHFISAKRNIGIDEIKELLKDKQTAIAGPSGVGKSTFINMLHEDFDLEVGEIGIKSKKGKHTTRHVELFTLSNGGLVFDTPGFTSFETMDIELEELSQLFPEFSKYAEGCRFKMCSHINEPDCSVKFALESGYINKSRYSSYINLQAEIKNQRRF